MESKRITATKDETGSKEAVKDSSEIQKVATQEPKTEVLNCTLQI